MQKSNWHKFMSRDSHRKPFVVKDVSVCPKNHENCQKEEEKKEVKNKHKLGYWNWIMMMMIIIMRQYFFLICSEFILYAHTHLNTHTHTHMHLRAYTHTHTHTHNTPTSTHTDMYNTMWTYWHILCVCVCVCVCCFSQKMYFSAFISTKTIFFSTNDARSS